MYGIRSALCAAMCALLAVAPVAAAPTVARPSLQSALHADLSAYLAQRGAIEHISAASLSVSLAPSQPNIDVAAGTTAFGGSTNVTPASLFQIGSNTKAFTAVMLLQLEAAGRLSIGDTVGKWLPQYSAWKSVTIRQLLDMTSGIPTYDNEGAVLARYAAHPQAFYSAAELLRAVYPKTSFAPGAGWLYSNTAYLLAQSIVERATGTDYAVQFDRRFIDGGPKLADTYYRSGLYPNSIVKRMVSGYFFSRDADNRALAPLVGGDVRGLSLSWAQGAGGVVATPEAVAHWVRALYQSPMLAAAQRRELLSLVSTSTGKPIASTSQREPRGFGLGVVQQMRPGLGRFWFYEGETLGYRVAYMYLPAKNLVIALGLNSQPDGKDDRLGVLLQSVATTLALYGKL